MTEAKWLVCQNPALMLRHLEPTVSDRKMRLFECACAQRVWHLVNDERLASVLRGLEDFADGLITAAELEVLHNLAWEIEQDDHAPPRSRMIAYELGIATRVKQPNSPFMDNGPIHTRSGEFSAALAASGTGGQEEFQRRKAAHRVRQTLMVRDIFCNPFRPITVDPSWLTSTVTALARGIYDERAFDRLPILADALQDAGCDHADILAHCRSDGPHVRGCWVVDLVLGKS